MNRYIVPLITSYYEYIEVDAESPEDAIRRVKDAEGEDYGTPEFREVLDVGPEDRVELRDEREKD